MPKSRALDPETHYATQPDGYPYDADDDTKRAFIVSLAPPMSDATKEFIRRLLLPRPGD